MKLYVAFRSKYQSAIISSCNPAHAGLKKQYSNETIMSIPLTNSNEYAHDSFITLKKQLYSDENNSVAV